MEDFADPIKSEINPEGYPEQDQIDLELVKVEADGETEVELGDFILFPDDVEPDYVPDTDPLDSLSSPEDCPVDDPLADPPPARKRRVICMHLLQFIAFIPRLTYLFFIHRCHRHQSQNAKLRKQLPQLSRKTI